MHSLMYFFEHTSLEHQHATEILIHHSTQFCWTTPYSGKNLILSLVFLWDSNGFLIHLLDTKPALYNLLVIVFLERVLFSEVLNSADSFCCLLVLSLSTVNFSRWSSLHDESLGLPDPSRPDSDPCMIFCFFWSRFSCSFTWDSQHCIL